VIQANPELLASCESVVALRLSPTPAGAAVARSVGSSAPLTPLAENSDTGQQEQGAAQFHMH
jgi:hypothetical protein